ncbi:hypothetical protein ABBQ32_000142 [Trebouxia sp. C0010 RCD-2024]
MSSACPNICSAQLTQQPNTVITNPFRLPSCHRVQPSFTTRRARCRPASLSCRHEPGSPSTAQAAGNDTQQQKAQALSGTALKAIALLAALNVLSSPALADLQTVPASQATEFAKPIPKQKTDKGFVALLFAGGAASIFGAAVLLEKNSKLFPAIHKANQVMREAALRSKGQSLAEQAVTDLEQQDNTRLQRSVEAGLASAQARVLPDSGDGSSASTSRAADIEADGSQSAGGVSSANGVSQQSHNDAQSGSSASSSSARPKGSQLSAAEKQKKAVNSVS